MTTADVQKTADHKRIHIQGLEDQVLCGSVPEMVAAAMELINLGHTDNVRWLLGARQDGSTAGERVVVDTVIKTKFGMLFMLDPKIKQSVENEILDGNPTEMREGVQTLLRLGLAEYAIGLLSMRLEICPADGTDEARAIIDVLRTVPDGLDKLKEFANGKLHSNSPEVSTYARAAFLSVDESVPCSPATPLHETIGASAGKQGWKPVEPGSSNAVVMQQPPISINPPPSQQIASHADQVRPNQTIARRPRPQTAWVTR